MTRAYGPEVVADLRGAVIGSAVWLLTALAAATGAVELTLIDVLLVLAPLVVVPVGLVVAGRDSGAARHAAAVGRRGPHRAGAARIDWLAPPAPWPCPGWPSPSSSSWWRRSRWLDRPDFSPGALARLASPVYLTVGATWLVASRLGLEPVGIGEPIVELTAVHFHYAGFAAALLAARTFEVASRVTPALGGDRDASDDRRPAGRRHRLHDRLGAGPDRRGAPAERRRVDRGRPDGCGRRASYRRRRRQGAARHLGGNSRRPMVLAVFWAAGQHYDVPALDVPAMARASTAP